MPHSKKFKEILWTLVIIFFLVVLIYESPRKFFFQNSFFNATDAIATDYVEKGLVRATTSFALARTFNAIVSVFRESELQLEPGGMGVSVAVGAALDPLNDLVERFSWVMLVSMTSLGVQKLLIEIVPFLSIQIFLVLALLSFLAGIWLSKILPINFIRMGKILLFVTILLRFALPAMAYLNNQVYVAFLEKKQNASVEALGQTIDKLEDQQSEISVPETTKDEGSEKEQGWLQKTKKTFKSVTSQGKEILDIRAKVEYLKNASSGLINHVVNLIVIFIFETILLPILFLWGFLKIGRLFISRGFGMAAEEWFLNKIGKKST